MKHFQLVCLLALFALTGCDQTPTNENQGAKATTTPDASAEVRDASRSTTVSQKEPQQAAEEPEEPLVAPVLSRAVPGERAEELVGDEPHGTLSGAAFGENSDVFGLARNDCGDGTVLRPIFKRSGSEKLEVGPPIPLDFYNLATGRPVTYEENDFRVTINVATDTPEKFDGQVRITYTERGKERVFVDLVYDGPPTDAVIPTVLQGEGRLIHYPNCYPSGYARLTASDGTTVRGLIRIVDLEGKGAAYARVTVGSASAIQILVVSRNPNKGIDPAENIMLEAARRTNGDVGILFDVSYRPELTTPAEAIGSNLGTMEKSKVLDGEATVRIWKEGGERYLDGTFEDVQISEIIEGPLSGKKFETIRIYGRMVAEDERPLELPPPPDFYKSDDAASESP